MKCFWPRCSDHKRCEAFGSCVALAQRAAIGDLPSRKLSRGGSDAEENSTPAPDHVAAIRGVIDELMTAAQAYSNGNVEQCRRQLTKAHVALETARAGFDKRHVERLPEIRAATLDPEDLRRIGKIREK